MRVLFIDDEELLVSVGRQILEASGFSVVACTSALLALDTFKAAPGNFDVVICDQMMPQMRGDDLVAQMRNLRPDVPVILCSGISHEKSMATLDAKLIYLSKPFSWDDLCEKIVALTSNQPAR